MEETTTTDSGAVTAQPQTDVAESTEKFDGTEQVINTDENGTPTLEPIASQAQTEPNEASADEAVSETTDTKETQATQTDDVKEWAEKKGLPLDDPVKLAKMYRDAEQKMHDATMAARQLETATVNTLDYTGDTSYDQLAHTVNQLQIQNSVRDFFTANPEAQQFESKMAEIVTERPHLKNDLDALYALARTDPSREETLKQEGGRKALQDIAQKHQQIPPASGATNSAVYESNQITPSNVWEMVDKNDQEWFQKNYEAINRAISCKS